jgi:hypothetical protein
MSDAIATDGDKSFMGVNQRLQINELQPGEVRESINGRMDGYWKPRKSVVARSAGLATSGRTLTLPFFLIDTNKALSTTVGACTWLNGVVTLTTTSAHELTLSQVAYATLGNTVLGSTPPLTNADPTKVPPAGNYEMTVTGTNTLTFPYALATGSGTYTVSGTTGYLHSQLNDGAVSDIFGSCLYSDPSSSNNEFILIATNTNVKKVLLDPPYTITTITLPPASTIDAECHMLQSFDKVLIFREGKQALQWNGNDADRFYPVASGPYTQPNVFELSTSFADGVATITLDQPADFQLLSGNVIGNGGSTVILPAYFDDGSPASDIDDFYVNSPSSPITVGATNATVTDYVAATRVATLSTGSFTAGTSYAMSNLRTSGARPGDIFKVVKDVAALDTISVNDVFVVATVPKYDKVTYASIETNTNPHDIQYSYLQSIGGGFSHMPAPPWATYFQRRLWVPYWYEVGGTLIAPTFSDRGIRDEIMASDIFDSDTYDQITAQFRITAGIADYTVAMQPFYDDALMVLNRNSLHLIAGTQGTLSDTIVKELTSEVGCLARKSVVIQGPNVLFLSDNGVYGLTFVEQYNLRGVEMPLSVNIQPYIDRINKNLANKATAVYFNNRYWLAVPLDSRVGAFDAVGNNTVLVYNFLNKGWESIDTYGDSRFNVMNFHIGKSGQRNALYIVTTTGGVHEVDVNEAANDVLAVDPALPTTNPAIVARLTSRGYDMQSLERKRFTDAQIQMQSLELESNCNVQISFSSQDPDAAEAINTTSTLIGEPLGNGDTANVRTRLAGIRGFTGTLILERISGSPKINSIAVSGSVTNRQIISQN